MLFQGTEVYDSKRGSFMDLEILDVLQIFGRAGRPQFDTSGHGTIITTYDKLTHYLSILTNQYHIESNFISCLVDNLNAEVLATIFSQSSEISLDFLDHIVFYIRGHPKILMITTRFTFVLKLTKKQRSLKLQCSDKKIVEM